MEKLVYTLSASAERSGTDLRRALIDSVAPAVRAAGGSALRVNVADEHVAMGTKVTIARSDPPMRAQFSFWLENADDRIDAEAALSAECDRLAGYLVAESRPVIHTPPIGERAPGANLVTCITRIKDLPDETFFECWNVEHRRVAVETQSTFAYIRNAVVRPLTREAPPYDGIVEESFPIEALTDPLVWYDCADNEELGRRVKRMTDSVRAFLDLSVIESTPMSEYYLG